MTLYPEAALAAELGIDMVALCVVTDVDSGEHAEEAVTAEIVFARLAEARPRLVAAIERIAASVPADYVARELIDRAAVAEVLGSGTR
jgi:5'-methylthioadenosine phosphorylase